MSGEIPELRAVIDEAIDAFSNWGKWGPEDGRGAMNYLTAELRCRAAALVRTGETFSLSIPVNEHGPQTGAFRRGNPLHTMLRTGADGVGRPQRTPHGLTSADDVLATPLQAGTHWDGLGHIFSHGFAWNGRDAGATVTSAGDAGSGIERLSDSVVGRGVLLDVGRVFGEAGVLADDFAITEEHLLEVMRRQDVSVREGDIVLLRTGKLGPAQRNRWKNFLFGPAPGLSFSTLGWLHRSRIAAIASDTAAVEIQPSEDPRMVFPLHQVMIPHIGLLVGEVWVLDQLAEACAADGIYEFLLSAPPLPVTGGVGSPVNPIAIR